MTRHTVLAASIRSKMTPLAVLPLLLWATRAGARKLSCTDSAALMSSLHGVVRHHAF